ncbi:Two-component system, response regulator, LytTR family [Alteracholeplasma palmae J233]|uniref:Two-component system, response regulator, LytTR family n=1 Tax=Alteracholeplasma palmae (strain ATCC 49389 / J233) TaxID=1318466 RepID=U4KLS5_ALTPJ|nr:LytTR family DNA-binding domain-containing protein [Alteracholeplasma palmae]CCV64877.1 Two-component system, response regulator, LytTR family [Alteracholeplasma palmae J233]
MNINIALCDDDKDVLSHYKKMISNISTPYILNINTFLNAMDLLDAVENDLNYYHLVLLDVEMSNYNGIEISKSLRKSGFQNEIIFLTDYVDYAYEAFDSYPFQYLHKKTLTKEKFTSVLTKVFALQDKKQREVFIANTKGETKIIPYSFIACFEAQGRYIVIYYEMNKSFEFIHTIQELENKLPKSDFIRVHRSYIINMAYLDSFQGNYLKLKNGLIIPIGATRLKEVKDLFTKYLIKQTEEE